MSYRFDIRKRLLLVLVIGAVFLWSCSSKADDAVRLADAASATQGNPRSLERQALSAAKFLTAHMEFTNKHLYSLQLDDSSCVIYCSQLARSTPHEAVRDLVANYVRQQNLTFESRMDLHVAAEKSLRESMTTVREFSVLRDVHKLLLQNVLEARARTAKAKGVGSLATILIDACARNTTQTIVVEVMGTDTIQSIQDLTLGFPRDITGIKDALKASVMQRIDSWFQESGFGYEVLEVLGDRPEQGNYVGLAFLVAGTATPYYYQGRLGYASGVKLTATGFVFTSSDGTVADFPMVSAETADSIQYTVLRIGDTVIDMPDPPSLVRESTTSALADRFISALNERP